MKNLGLNPNQHELESIIDDVDQIGNGEINFDDFCDVMKRVNANKQTWNEMVQECFRIFDRVSRVRQIL
jgi:calmodulin